MPRVSKPKKIKGVSQQGDVWVARYKYNGADVRKVFDTQSEAASYLEKMRTMKRMGEEVSTSAKQPLLTKAEREKRVSGILLSDLCDKWLTHIQNPNNPERPKDQVNPPIRIDVIKEAFKGRVAAAIEPHEIKNWLTSFGRSPATLNRYKSTLSAVYSYGREQRLVKGNPCREVEHFKVQEKPVEWMSDKDEKKLRAVIQKWIKETPEHHAMTRLELREHLNELTLGSQTGMRKGNQYSLTWEDVDFEEKLITLPDTKGGKPHRVAMTDDVFAALKDQEVIQEQMRAIRGDGKVRMVLDGRVFTIRENREWFDKAKNQAGLHKLTWHKTSRHTAGSRLGLAGANQKLIQSVLGHATLAMSGRYTHLDKEYERNVMNEVFGRRSA